MNKILIIGGAGFIGHNMALQLKQKNYDLKVIDSLQINNLYSIDKSSDLPFPKMTMSILEERMSLFEKNKIKINQIDSRNYEKLSETILEFDPNVIIHLAAVSHANKSNLNPYQSFDNSLLTLENSLDISRNLKNLKRFIYFSSSMVYGNFTQDFVDEKTECNPIGIYGTLKFCCEKIIIAYNQVFNLPYTIIRPSALYGERCISRRVGQIFIENLLNKKNITLSGDGKEKLDFTYIDDLVHGVDQVIQKKESLNQIFNITYGEGRSISDLIEILKTEFNDIKIEYISRDKLMPKRGKLICDKAKSLIKYNPKWNLETGYQKYIQWYKDFFIRYTSKK